MTGYPSIYDETGGAGSVAPAIRSDNGEVAVFATFAALEVYAATSSGTADANRINVPTIEQASEVFVVGALSNNAWTGTPTTYARVNGAWRLTTANLQGPPGVDGTDGANALDVQFSSVADRDQFFTAAPELLKTNLPISVVVTPGVVEMQTWTGSDSPANYNAPPDGVLWQPASIRSGTSSFELADSQALTSGGDNILLEERVRGISAVPVGQVLGDHQNPASRLVGNTPLARRYTPGDGLPPFASAPSPAAASGSVAFDTSFSVGAENSAIFGIEFIPTENYTGILEYNLVNTDANRTVYTSRVDVVLVSGTPFTQWFRSPASSRAGANVRGRLYKEDRTALQVRPRQDSATTPYTNSHLRRYEDEPVITASVFEPVQDAVTALQRTAFNSGRAFIRFNDGFNVGDAGFEAATVRNKNLIYTAKNQKPIDSPTRPDVILPTHAEIVAAGGYPFPIEFTHIGGTGFSTVDNLLRLFASDGTTLLQTLFFDQFTIASKPSETDPWEFSTASFDANSFVLASGVVNLSDTEIQNAEQIPTELNGVTIHKGDAFVVNTGGDWGQYTGDASIPDHSILMALIDGASIADQVSNVDWFLFTDGLLDAKATALLNNFAQDGVKFTGNRNIRIDPSNVLQLSNMAANTPITRELGSNTQGANRSVRFGNSTIQFSDFVGGQLTVTLAINLTRTSGFSPVFTAFELTYPGGFTFTFPLGRVDGDGSQLVSTITIPNADYSAMLNQNPTLQTLYFDFFGASFIGSYTVGSVINMSTGELNSAVAFVASQEASKVQQEVNGQIARLTDEIDNDGAALNALTPRISPIRNTVVSTPEVNSFFLDSTGSDSAPASLSVMSPVSSDNPRFTGGNVALYIAAPGGANHVLKNITADTVLALDASEATVSILESFFENNTSYFVYQVTGLTSGHVYEVERTEVVSEYSWPTDIESNKQSIARIDAELEHALLGLSDEVVQVLENELTVTEQTTPSIVPSEYNKGLAGTASQTVFYEPNENAGSGGLRTSRPLNENTGDQARRKLIYFEQGQTFTNQAYLHAFDGSTVTDLIRYANGVFSAQVFVPAIPAGTSTHEVYPAPSNRVSGEGVWIRVPTLTFSGGVPVPEADEVFFTRNIPSQSHTLTIQYRGHANGNVFGAGSATLAGVGGSSEVATTFTLNDGSETATVEVRYYPAANNIRVSVTERVNTGLPTINDVEVILSYSETRTVPSTPATVREVEIDRASGRPYVFAIKPSASGSLILAGRELEIDTGYAYTTLFSANESGHLAVVGEGSQFLNYEDFEPISSTILDLENRATLPQYGLFTTIYNRETDLNIGVTIKPSGLNISDLPTSATGLATGDVWFNGASLQFV